MKRNERTVADRFRNPTKILAFDNKLKLAAIFSSYNMAERLTGILHQKLVRACKGKSVAIGKFYWRELEDNEDEALVVESSDIGTLSLLDYDKEIGIEREIYYTTKMKKGEIIPESEFANKHQFFRSIKYQQWKHSRRKRHGEL